MRYYFDLTDEVSATRDDDGREFRDISGAQRHALRILAAIGMDETPPGGQAAYAVLVRNERGEDVCRVTARFATDDLHTARGGPSGERWRKEVRRRPRARIERKLEYHAGRVQSGRPTYHMCASRRVFSQTDAVGRNRRLRPRLSFYVCANLGAPDVRLGIASYLLKGVANVYVR